MLPIHYTFKGWYDNINYTGNPITNIAQGTTGDITLYASWTINQYTISFNSNGGSSVSAITQDYNSELIEPTEPIKEWYTFEGWYIDEAYTYAYTFTTMPASSITLYAKYSLNERSIKLAITQGLIANGFQKYDDYYFIKTLTNPAYGFNMSNGKIAFESSQQSVTISPDGSFSAEYDYLQYLNGNRYYTEMVISGNVNSTGYVVVSFSTNTRDTRTSVGSTLMSSVNTTYNLLLDVLNSAGITNAIYYDLYSIGS